MLRRWCGCESLEAHFQLGGLRPDLPRRCRLAEGIELEQGETNDDDDSETESDSESVKLAPKTIAKNESETESDSESVKLAPKTVAKNESETESDSEVAGIDLEHDGTVKKVNPMKRNWEEPTVDITCKKQKKSDNISICIKVSNLVINISIEGRNDQDM